MIVARGTTEAAGEGTSGAIANLVAAQIAGSGSIGDVYSATYVDPLYPISVSDDISDTINLIEKYVDACWSSSRIVLIGFSQGAEVISDTLAGGIDKPAPIAAPYAQYSSSQG